MEVRQLRAIKVVELVDLDQETLEGYRNEINILKRLQSSNRIIKLYDHEETACQLKGVMEKEAWIRHRSLKLPEKTLLLRPTSWACIGKGCLKLSTPFTKRESFIQI